jgi:hypothetical protein
MTEWSPNLLCNGAWDLHAQRTRMSCKTTASRRTGRGRAVGAAAALGVSAFAASSEVWAQPLRLRADALAETQSPTGLVVLQAQDAARPWVEAEGLIWAGTKPEPTGDVMVLTVRVREPHGYGELRAGRFVLATGAVHPVQLDGAEVIGRAPWGGTIESFGGLPVVPRFGSRSYDWLAGGRVAQSITSEMTFGVSYVQRRAEGEISNEEVGADFAAAPVRWLDVAARGSYDVTSPGIAEALATLAARLGGWRLELFASQRSPGRLLPATSLFSVLGDFPSQMVGATVRWRAAPRLDVLASGAGQLVGGELGANGWIRATLRLDDRGDGNMGLEARREDVVGAVWTGVRGIAALPLGQGLRYSTEVEIVVPDQPDARGVAWPWGLIALSWGSRAGWEIAGALEASSTPQHRYEADALLRVSRALEVP